MLRCFAATHLAKVAVLGKDHGGVEQRRNVKDKARVVVKLVNGPLVAAVEDDRAALAVMVVVHVVVLLEGAGHLPVEVVDGLVENLAGEEKKEKRTQIR